MSSISVHLYSKGAAAQQREPGQARQDQDNNRQHLSNVNKQRHVILGLPRLHPPPPAPLLHRYLFQIDKVC